MSIYDVSSASTLSLKYKPGENKRLLNSNSQSIFSFGDFHIEKDLENNYLSGVSNHLQFDNFSTLTSLSVTGFQSSEKIISVKESELNLKSNDPKSYAYFSSFYTEVATAINNIIDNYPYAVLAWNNGATNIFSYNETINVVSGTTSSFKLYFSALTNQGEIMINSGNSVDRYSILSDMERFVIQISGESNTHKILDYSFSGGQLSFKIEGCLFDNHYITSSPNAIYIRPTKEIISDYKKNLGQLEKQILYNGEFQIPNVEYAGDISYLEEFVWPKSIDGFAPDSYGTDFDTFKENILAASEKIDEEKTNIFLKTIIPENYIEHDSDREIFRTIIQTYAHEFDKFKKFIDAIAYSHSINYNGEESVPTKFISKLSNLLGWELSESFNELDLFSYLTEDDNNTDNNYSYFNLEIWKRVLVNIVWLYKKKGTRDAIMFIFKILGAPDCLVNFNEFVYDVKKAIISTPTSVLSSLQIASIKDNGQIVTFDTGFKVPTNLQQRFTPVQITIPPITVPPVNINNIQTFSRTTETFNEKIDDFGYPNYYYQPNYFQFGGKGRGNGQEYINFWTPEFDMKIRVDNVKVQTGNTDLTIGTKDIVNTKEVEIGFDPARAVECDMFEFYQQDCSCLYDISYSSVCPSYSSSTIPEEYKNFNCYDAKPLNITAMTLSQYIDYVFTNSVNPKNRKTFSQKHTSWTYPELKNIYLNYYYSTNPSSNSLTVGKLEAYLDLIGVRLDRYIQQLLPATTIIKGGKGGITYRNPLPHRQKFVYKEGINEGSTFQTPFPEDISPIIYPYQISFNSIRTIVPIITPTQISTIVPELASVSTTPILLSSSISNTTRTTNTGFGISMNVVQTNNISISAFANSSGIQDNSRTRTFRII